MKYYVILHAMLINLFLAGCSDIVSNNYATHQSALNDKLFQRGWLPDILPATTINIRTKNNLDLNTSVGSFEIPASDLDVFKSKLTHMKKHKYGYSYGKAFKDPTWKFAVDSKTGKVTYVYSLQKSR